MLSMTKKQYCIYPQMTTRLISNSPPDCQITTTYTHTRHSSTGNTSGRLPTLYRTIKAGAIRIYSRHQIAIIQSAPGGRRRQRGLCVSWSHLCSGILAGLGMSWQAILRRDAGQPTYTHKQTHTHTHTERIHYTTSVNPLYSTNLNEQSVCRQLSGNTS